MKSIIERSPGPNLANSEAPDLLWSLLGYCGGLNSLYTNTDLVTDLMKRLMAGDTLSTAELTLLAGVPTYRICSCYILISGVLNWTNVNQLKALLIPY